MASASRVSFHYLFRRCAPSIGLVSSRSLPGHTHSRYHRYHLASVSIPISTARSFASKSSVDYFSMSSQVTARSHLSIRWMSGSIFPVSFEYLSSIWRVLCDYPAAECPLFQLWSHNWRSNDERSFEYLSGIFRVSGACWAMMRLPKVHFVAVKLWFHNWRSNDDSSSEYLSSIFRVSFEYLSSIFQFGACCAIMLLPNVHFFNVKLGSNLRDSFF